MMHVNFKLNRDVFSLDVDFKLPNHGITALFGPSGCGKTTLLRCIAGFELESEGVLTLATNVWQDFRTNVFVSADKRPIAFVFQHPTLFPHLSVRENLAFAYKRSTDKRLKINDVADMTGITALLSRHPGKLSGGERQRVALARAVLTHPSLLLLDEPLSALDQQSRAQLIPYVEKLHTTLAIPILYVSHVLEEVAQLCEHMVLMETGRVIAIGPLVEVLSRLDSYPTGHENVMSVINANVIDYDQYYQLARLQFIGGDLHLPLAHSLLGTSVRIAIHAKDVSLTLIKPEQTSILNILSAKIDDIAFYATAQVLIRLQVGEQYILTRITRKSFDKLKLNQGIAVFAQIKSVSLVD